uniref:Lipoprotein n=1 Tax=viral metagenome TaxID=1070528 RepID=A0A6H2A0K5_9ZZZZ
MKKLFIILVIVMLLAGCTVGDWVIRSPFNQVFFPKRIYVDSPVIGIKPVNPDGWSIIPIFYTDIYIWDESMEEYVFEKTVEKEAAE